MKRHYQMPTIKVVAFRVEAGFQNYTNVNVGSWAENSGRITIAQDGDGTSYFSERSTNLPTILN